MRTLIAFLALPSCLLQVVAATQQPGGWPYSLPRTAKYYPEHDAHERRHAEILEKLERQTPLSVRKMAEDPGEKFRLDYWGFADAFGLRDDSGIVSSLEESQLKNESLRYYDDTLETIFLRSPSREHTNQHSSYMSLFSRNLFGRAFQCPANTKSCASIGHPSLCCDTGELCVSTSSGVGCCPAGETCGQQISGCDTGAGYTSCPNSPNGGCCVPGAKCEGAGCVFVGTLTVTTNLPTSTETRVVTSTPSISAASRPSPSSPSTSLYRTTIVVTSPSAHTTTKTVTVTAPSVSHTCSSGFFSCPASFGGGCCRNGQACATDGKCPDVASTTVTPGPPIRQTSVSGTTTTSVPTGVCPGGYYMCSAYYLGDCCQVGRNCDTTSCPPQYATTVVTNGQTVVVSGTGAPSAATTTGTCAHGWALCSASVGGGCCPSGYICGTVSCSASISGQGITAAAKEAPSGASVMQCTWGLLIVGVVSGTLMLWL